MNFTYFKQIIRSLIRHKIYSGINILGLGIGLGCTILMAIYIIHEFSFDKYHKNSSTIYRVVDGNECGTYYSMGEAYKDEIPEIGSVCRLFDINSIKVKQGHQFIEEDKIVFSDPSLLTMLDIEIINGTSENQLLAPDEILISEKIAKKYYPNEDPVGQLIELAIGQRILSFKVNGVYQNFPSYSSLQTDFIGNIENAFSLIWDITYTLGFTEEKPLMDYRQVWEHDEFTTLVQLNPNADKAITESKCSEICLQHREVNEHGGIQLQPLSQIYLHSNDLDNSDIFNANQLSSLKTFMGIGLLILLIAIINFILISNADNNLSITEIACRKVNGASRRQILNNSIVKSVFVAFISMIPAIIFVQLMLPVFNNLFQKDLSVSLFMQVPYIAALVIITLLTGVISGLYLGAYISRINPASLFQKNIFYHEKHGWLKGSLVIVQFIIFILLSSSYFFMLKQYRYSLNKDLGLNSENILAININNDEMRNKVEYLKQELLTDPNVIDCKPTSFTIPPSDNYLNFEYRNPETDKPESIEALVFGAGVIEMLEIPVIDGRAYNETDGGFAEKFILNEAAAKKYNVKAGDKIHVFDVVGIVKNFHYHSLHRPVEPVFIAHQDQNYPYLLVKTNGRNREVAESARELFQKVSPSYYMEYELLDDRIIDFYKKEEKQMGTIGFFSAIALALSIMGLLGFVALNLVKRTKEIGIRKINGANISELLKMMNYQYIKWIVIAFCIACPLGYFAINKWLENFAYKTTLSWWIFALAGIIAVGIALITVSWQSWRAANKNPVEALRYE